MIGKLSWKPELPGNEILPALFIGIFGFFILMVGTAYIFMGRAREFAVQLSQVIEAQEAAKLARDQLAQAIERLSESVVLFDQDDRIVFCNRHFRQSNAAVIEFTEAGTRFEDLLLARLKNGLVPEALGKEEEWLAERMQRHLNPTGPIEFERKDGRWDWIKEEKNTGRRSFSIRG